MEKEIALNEELKEIRGRDVCYLVCKNSVGAMILQFCSGKIEISAAFRTLQQVHRVGRNSRGLWRVAGYCRPALRILERKYYGDKGIICGRSGKYRGLKTTIVKDTARVNALAIGFVFLILLYNFKSISLPVILTLVIETSIWINLTIPYFQSINLFLYRISDHQLSTAQATIDYGILLTDRYMENRKRMLKKEAMLLFGQAVYRFNLYIGGHSDAGRFPDEGTISTNNVLSQLGTLLGRGRSSHLFLSYLYCPTC